MTAEELTDEVASYYRWLAPDYNSRSGYSRRSIAEETGALGERITSLFAGHRVLETACGTGYWTRLASRSAEYVLAVDASCEMLLEAERFCRDLSNVTFQQADAYSLIGIPGGFSGALSVLWWCHMPLEMVSSYLGTLHGKLLPGARILHACQLEDMDACDHSSDEYGNIIARRRAASRDYRIVKNVPSEDYLRRVLSSFAEGIEYTIFPGLGLWSIEYTLQTQRN